MARGVPEGLPGCMAPALALCPLRWLAWGWGPGGGTHPRCPRPWGAGRQQGSGAGGSCGGAVGGTSRRGGDGGFLAAGLAAELVVAGDGAVAGQDLHLAEDGLVPEAGLPWRGMGTKWRASISEHAGSEVEKNSRPVPRERQRGVWWIPSSTRWQPSCRLCTRARQDEAAEGQIQPKVAVGRILPPKHPHRRLQGALGSQRGW